MLNCILLTIILLIMLIINYIFFKKCIIEPAFIFNFSFFVSSFVLTFASAKWNVDINNLTILTIVFSIAFFSINCNVIKYIFRKKSNKPNITILVYAYIFGGLFFAFFGNKFYSQIFNLGFVKYIILWCLLNYILFSRKKWLKWLQYWCQLIMVQNMFPNK